MLSWKVLNYDSNKHKIVDYEVLRFYEEPLKKARKKKEFSNYEELKEWLRRKFMHDYWSKTECEIAVGDLFSKEDELEKVDIFRQLNMNLDRITEYVIRELKFRF